MRFMSDLRTGRDPFKQRVILPRFDLSSTAPGKPVPRTGTVPAEPRPAFEMAAKNNQRLPAGYRPLTNPPPSS
jgi:hypothetical protein